MDNKTAVVVLLLVMNKDKKEVIKANKAVRVVKVATKEVKANKAETRVAKEAIKVVRKDNREVNKEVRVAIKAANNKFHFKIDGLVFLSTQFFKNSKHIRIKSTFEFSK